MPNNETVNEYIYSASKAELSGIADSIRQRAYNTDDLNFADNYIELINKLPIRAIPNQTYTIVGTNAANQTIYTGQLILIKQLASTSFEFYYLNPKSLSTCLELELNNFSYFIGYALETSNNGDTNVSICKLLQVNNQLINNKKYKIDWKYKNNTVKTEYYLPNSIPNPTSEPIAIGKTFSTWTPAIAEATEDTSYTATFTAN